MSDPAPTPSRIKSELDVVLARFDHAKRSMAEADIEELEKEYFALRTRLRPDLGEAECRELLGSVIALERKLPR